MSTDQRSAVGREATPPPPNIGQSSLGSILRLGSEPGLQDRRWVHCLGSPLLRQSLEDAGLSVWPAVPGLAVEALDLVPVDAVVIEEAALESGPWAGASGDVAPDLAQQVADVIERSTQLKAPVYWLSTASSDREAGEGQPAVLPVDHPGALLVAPGSRLFDGVPEGAPPTRLLHCLRNHVSGPGR